MLTKRQIDVGIRNHIRSVSPELGQDTGHDRERGTFQAGNTYTIEAGQAG